MANVVSWVLSFWITSVQIVIRVTQIGQQLLIIFAELGVNAGVLQTTLGAPTNTNLSTKFNVLYAELMDLFSTSKLRTICKNTYCIMLEATFQLSALVNLFSEL